MPVLNPGTTFSNGEQLTASDLNLLLQGATFTQSSVDNLSTQLVGTAIVVADGGIIASKLAADAVTTSKILDANVTKTKIENVADYKVLGNVSGAAAAPQEVAILDEDDMVSDSATALATQQSIKAYVDSSTGIIQTALGSTTTQVETTLVIPHDDTTPLITEGISAGLSATMTPTSTSSTIRATLNAYFGNSSAGQYIIIATFEGNTCVGASQIQQPNSGNTPLSATYYFNPASTSEQTYSVRFGRGSSGTARLDTTPTLGGLNKATLFLEELS
jgi:hypothetical protein